jgi:hypothetical protein
MKTYGGSRLHIHVFLTSAPVGATFFWTSTYDQWQPRARNVNTPLPFASSPPTINFPWLICYPHTKLLFLCEMIVTEVGSQRSDHRSRITEVGSQKSDHRGRITEVGSQRSDHRGRITDPCSSLVLIWRDKECWTCHDICDRLCQSSWLQNQRSGFDILSLVSTTEELLDRKVAAPV